MVFMLAVVSTAAYADHRGSQRPGSTPVPITLEPQVQAPLADVRADEARETDESGLFDSHFLVLSGEVGWQSVDRIGYVEGGGLYGLQFGDGEGRYWKPWRLYVLAEGDRDNRSGIVQGFPQTFFENRLISSAGVAWLPIDQVAFFAQYDVGFDIANLHRGTDSGVKLGVQSYHQWGYYPETPSVPRLVGDVYGQLAYQSRFSDDVTFDSTLKTGFRVSERPWAVFDVLGVVRTYGSKNNDGGFLSFGDTGAQLSWKPSRDSPVSLNVSSVWRFDFKARNKLYTDAWLGYWQRFDL